MAKNKAARPQENQEGRKGGAQKDSPATVTIVANPATVPSGAQPEKVEVVAK